MELNELIIAIKDEFPDKAIDLYESMDLLLETIRDTMDSIQDKTTEEMNNRDFNKVTKYVNLGQELHNYEFKINELLDNINTEDIQEYSEASIDIKRELPNYEEYRVDSSIEHTLKEDFTHKRPSSFTIGKEYSSITYTWQEMLLDTCRYLYKLDEIKFNTLPDNSKLNGRKTAYFSRNKEKMRKPIHIGKGMYIESNMSANSIRNLIIRLLKEFNIPTNSFKVYLKADYTNLNNQLSLNI